MAQRIVSDDDVRRRLMPGATDAQVARAMREVYEGAITESLKFGGHWWGPPPSVDAFIAQHDPNAA